MSHRQKAREQSLKALARLAAGMPPPPPPPAEAPRRAPAPAKPPKENAPPKPKAKPKPVPKPEDPLEGRNAKREEERLLRERRENELFRAGHMEYRSYVRDEMPHAFRKAAYNRRDPSLADKIRAVIPEPEVKDGRARNRDRGRRQGRRGG